MERRRTCLCCGRQGEEKFAGKGKRSPERILHGQGGEEFLPVKEDSFMGGADGVEKRRKRDFGDEKKTE